MRRDINLLPRKRESSPAKTRTVAIVVLIAVLYAAMLFVGIKVPGDIKNALEKEKNSLDEQLLLLEEVSIEYDQIAAQIEVVKANSIDVGNIANSKHPAEVALKTIQDSCPDGVMILSLDLNEIAMQIYGKAETDEQIAQFMLELQRNGVYEATSISSIMPAAIAKTESADDPTVENMEGREFEIYLVYGIELPEVIEEEEGEEADEN